MADYEVSKIMWVAIVVALAASIFVIAKPQINTLANSTFDKISSITSGIRVSEIKHTAYANNAEGTDGFSTTKPNLNLLDGTRNPVKITGDGTINNATMAYHFGGKQLKDIVVAGMNVTLSFDWQFPAKGGSGTFQSQLNDWPWGIGPNVNVSDGSGHFSESIPVSDAMATSSADGIRIRMDNVTTTMTISNMKFEISSTATPHMPSASEVKPSDQPKYIGTYTDKSDSASQDPSKYTWKLNPDYHE